MYTRNWFHRRRRSGAIGSLTIVFVLSFVAYATWGKDRLAVNEKGSRKAEATQAASGIKKERVARLREGTKLDGELGRFAIRGERMVFQSTKDGRSFVGLENLNMERISRQLDNQFEDLDWSVDGRVTEYRGANYLLVTRATLKTRSRDKSTSN